MKSKDYYIRSSVVSDKINIAIKCFFFASLIIFVPDNAHADAFVPFVWTASLEMILALIPIIIIEAITYIIFLKLPLGIGFKLSIAANLLSTLIGVVIRFILSLGPHGSLYIDSLVAVSAGEVLFIITLAIEYPVARYILPNYRSLDILISVFCANIASYGIILLYILLK